MSFHRYRKIRPVAYMRFDRICDYILKYECISIQRGYIIGQPFVILYLTQTLCLSPLTHFISTSFLFLFGAHLPKHTISHTLKDKGIMKGRRVIKTLNRENGFLALNTKHDGFRGIIQGYRKGGRIEGCYGKFIITSHQAK